MGNFLRQLQSVKTLSLPDELAPYRTPLHARANARVTAAASASLGALLLLAPKAFLRFRGGRGPSPAGVGAAVASAVAGGGGGGGGGGGSSRAPHVMVRAFGALLLASVPYYLRAAEQAGGTHGTAARFVHGSLSTRLRTFAACILVLFAPGRVPPALLAYGVLNLASAAHASLSAPPVTACHRRRLVESGSSQSHAHAHSRRTALGGDAGSNRDSTLPLSVRVHVLGSEVLGMVSLVAPSYVASVLRLGTAGGGGAGAVAAARGAEGWLQALRAPFTHAPLWARMWGLMLPALAHYGAATVADATCAAEAAADDKEGLDAVRARMRRLRARGVLDGEDDATRAGRKQGLRIVALSRAIYIAAVAWLAMGLPGVAAPTALSAAQRRYPGLMVLAAGDIVALVLSAPAIV